jgi:hypothetical protein
MSAKPISKVMPYRLTRGSTYKEGCVPPCFCPIRSSHLTGAFLLIPSSLSDISAYSYYRMSKISWNVVDQEGVIHKIRGRGTYLISDQTTNPVYHQLERNPVIDGIKPQHFDSGPVEKLSGLPLIKINVSKDTGCYDIWMDLNAIPK